MVGWVTGPLLVGTPLTDVSVGIGPGLVAGFRLGPAPGSRPGLRAGDTGPTVGGNLEEVARGVETLVVVVV